jgi:flagellar hook-length control protein FliK
VVDQVVQGARWLISNHRNEMTVKLHPEHLGELNLKVVHKDGLFRVDMTVDSLAAKHLLESNLTQLREHLHAENPAAGEFLFNVDVRKGNDSRPEAYARMSRDVGAARPVDALEPAEEAVRRGLGRGAWGNHSLSIYA